MMIWLLLISLDSIRQLIIQEVEKVIVEKKLRFLPEEKQKWISVEDTHIAYSYTNKLPEFDNV